MITIYFLLSVFLFLSLPVNGYAHLCDNVFRQADKLIVKPENYNLTVKDETSFKIFLQNNMDRAIAEISLIAESRAFNFNIIPQVMRIPKGSRVYFTVRIRPKQNTKTGYYPINFRLVGGGRQFKSFSLNVQDEQASKVTASNTQESVVSRTTISPARTSLPAVKTTTSTTSYITDTDKTNLLNIKQLTNPPQIDGILDDDCWKKTAVMANFSSEKGGNAAYTTIGLMGFNTNSVYFAVHCLGADIQKLSGNDIVEIQLSPDKPEDSFYSLTLPAVGTPKLTRIFSHIGNIGIGLPENSAYRVFSDADYWSAELSLPLYILKTSCPSEITKWFVRVIRTQSSNGEEKSYWSQDTSGYNKKEGFGEILLVP